MSLTSTENARKAAKIRNVHNVGLAIPALKSRPSLQYPDQLIHSNGRPRRNNYMKPMFIAVAMAIVSCIRSADLPSGAGTCYGAACDLASAFINCDAKLFRQICMKSDKPEYVKFIDDVCRQMDVEKSKPAADRHGPREIQIVFKFGALSRNGPNSYAYAVKELDEIGFVDVGVENYDLSRSANRTFVFRKGSVWKVLPRPDLFPLLTDGLNEEKRPSLVEYRKINLAQQTDAPQPAANADSASPPSIPPAR